MARNTKFVSSLGGCGVDDCTVDGPLAVGRWGLSWEGLYRHLALIRGHAAHGSGMEVGHVPAEAVEASFYCAGPLWLGVHSWIDEKGAAGYP